jgi:hypothetical protein
VKFKKKEFTKKNCGTFKRMGKKIAGIDSRQGYVGLEPEI